MVVLIVSLASIAAWMLYQNQSKPALQPIRIKRDRNQQR